MISLTDLPGFTIHFQVKAPVGKEIGHGTSPFELQKPLGWDREFLILKTHHHIAVSAGDPEAIFTVKALAATTTTTGFPQDKRESQGN